VPPPPMIQQTTTLGLFAVHVSSFFLGGMVRGYDML
jgi:hypothetical protein